MSCKDCVFRSQYQDMGASEDVCILHRNLLSAISACERSEGCRYRFMLSEAKEIVKARAGGLPVDKPIARPREQSGDPEQGFDDAMVSLKEAFGNMAKALVDEIKSFEKALAEREGKG